ncbi:response regulator [Pseudomonas sp. MAG002Y]|uniref:response regulator n=1 Tax=Pseudomonas sp. MAG002Y TaxID=2678690 RepID=UPI001C60D414|nr:response regulator [Pseudomonas sp. MAG002Y]MBW5415229.1 response regulator [Pseudomonas sp. MAG002Y]
MRCKHILLVEDEPKLAALLKDYLQAASYKVSEFANGLDVLPAFKAEHYDLVLLDIMLPGRDGLDLCRDIRQISQVPIIMVTARVDEIDRLLGLELGADDYICKPFSPREVVARVKAVLRRVGAVAQSTGLTIDLQGYQASYNGKALDLTAVEFRLISALAKLPGRVMSRDQLMNHLYNDHRLVTDRTVDSHVRNVRKKLEKVAPGLEFIRSIYGAGYCLEEKPLLINDSTE